VRAVAERAGHGCATRPRWSRSCAFRESRTTRARARVVPAIRGPGGSGVVVYRVGAGAARDGVRAGTWFFPGGPLPGGGIGERLALFGVPWTSRTTRSCASWPRTTPATRPSSPSRTASSGSRRSRPDCARRCLPREGRDGDSAADPWLEDRGGLLDNYLQINRELRKRNAEELVSLASRSARTFLWTGPFLPLRNAKVMSAFADQRTYVYQGKNVDAQTHLGFDLAVVARTPVPAANAGVVLLSRYFGIYGNTVVLDHGLASPPSTRTSPRST